MDNFRLNPRIKMLWETLNAIGCELEGEAAPVPRASFWSNDQGERRNGFYLTRKTKEDFSEQDIDTIRKVADSLGFNLRSHADFEIDDDRYRNPSLTFDL